MKRSLAVSAALCGALVTSVVAAQQSARRALETRRDDKVGVAIALQAGGDSYRFTGRGTCTHAPRGYIHTVPAQLWGVEQTDGTSSVALTLWRPASGSGDMFMLYVQAAGRTYMTNTVKSKNAGSTEGSGEVRFAAAGGGGTFTVNAIAANGAKISGTIRCDGFRAAYAEGGN